MSWITWMLIGCAWFVTIYLTWAVTDTLHTGWWPTKNPNRHWRHSWVVLRMEPQEDAARNQWTNVYQRCTTEGCNKVRVIAAEGFWSIEDLAFKARPTDQEGQA